MMNCTLGLRAKINLFLLDVSFAKYFVTAMRKAALTVGKRLPPPGATSRHSSLANTPDTHHLAVLSRLSFGTLRRYVTDSSSERSKDITLTEPESQDMGKGSQQSNQIHLLSTPRSGCYCPHITNETFEALGVKHLT